MRLLLTLLLVLALLDLSAQTKTDLLQEQAQEYYRSGNYFKTAESYQRAIKLDARMNKCMAHELTRSYAHLNKYDSALIYWELLYKSRDYGPIPGDFNKAEYENLEYFEHSTKDTIWDPIRETEEWMQTRDRIRHSFLQNLDEVNWKYRNVMDSLYWANKDLEKERIKVLNQSGFGSKEMNGLEKKVEQHKLYSIEQVRLILNEIGFPSRKEIGNEGNRYFLQVLKWTDKEFIERYWPEIEDAYLSGILLKSHYDHLVEIRNSN